MKELTRTTPVIAVFSTVLWLTACIGRQEQTLSASNSQEASAAPDTNTLSVNDTNTLSVNITQDLVSPTRKWSFNYRDGQFPCDTTGGCMIKGFAVGENETFYFIGGTPASIAKYHGNQLLSSCKLVVDLMGSRNALFQISNDSLYIVDEQNKLLYSIDTALTSKPVCHSLLISAEDSIVFGRMGKRDYVIRTQNYDYEFYGEHNRQRSYLFSYPNKRIDVQDYKEEPPISDGYCKPQSDKYLDFFGTVGCYRVFLDEPIYDECTLVITDSVGRILLEDELLGLPPIAAVCGTEEHYGWMASSNLRHLLNHKLYVTGYDFNRFQFSILEYDLSVLAHYDEQKISRAKRH